MGLRWMWYLIVGPSSHLYSGENSAPLFYNQEMEVELRCMISSNPTAAVGSVHTQRPDQLFHWPLTIPLRLWLPASSFPCPGEGSLLPICLGLHSSLSPHLGPGQSHPPAFCDPILIHRKSSTHQGPHQPGWSKGVAL